MKLLILIPLFLVVSGLPSAEIWNADTANAKITFSVDGPFGMVNGSFTGLKATLQFNPDDLAGSFIKASVDPATVDSHNWLRNRHLRNEEQFLNVDKYKLLEFSSTEITKTSTGFIASGNLTLKDVTKPLGIPFTFSSSGNSGVFKGAFSINRMDYHIGTEGGSVGSVINISIVVPVTR